MESTLKEKNCSYGSKFFPIWDNPIYMGGNNENDQAASPESVQENNCATLFWNPCINVGVMACK